MKNSYSSFREMESFVCDFCDEVVLFCNYEEEDLVKCYINNIFTFYIQEEVIRDINENGFNEDLFDMIGNIDVDLPDEIIDFYRDAVDLRAFDIPKEKKMAPI